MASVSETSKYRHLVAQYCVGNGIDVGSSGDPVVPTAIQIDLPLGEAYSPDLGGQHPVQLRGDGTKLHWFRDMVFDYVFSSHLLEDFVNWEPVVREWSRVLKRGGHLIILMPDKERWQAALGRGQPPNLAHKHEGRPGELSALIAKIGGYDVILDGYCTPDDPTDYGLVFVARKRPLELVKRREIVKRHQPGRTR